MERVTIRIGKYKAKRHRRLALDRCNSTTVLRFLVFAGAAKSKYWAKGVLLGQNTISQ